MTDREVLNLLVSRFASHSDTANALGLSVDSHFFYNWRTRGVPRGWRRTVLEVCRRRGVFIDAAWCGANKNRQERAALDKSLRLVARKKNGGPTNGKAKGTRKTQRPTAQRRPASGRGVPAPPR